MGFLNDNNNKDRCWLHFGICLTSTDFPATGKKISLCTPNVCPSISSARATAAPSSDIVELQRALSHNQGISYCGTADRTRDLTSRSLNCSDAEPVLGQLSHRCPGGRKDSWTTDLLSHYPSSGMGSGERST